MAIEVIIKRKVKAGHQAKQLVPLILKLRAMALNQPGYISGQTLSNIEKPEECIVISRWESIDDWNRWLNSEERSEIDDWIESLTGQPTEYRIYAPMVLELNFKTRISMKLKLHNIQKSGQYPILNRDI